MIINFKIISSVFYINSIVIGKIYWIISY